jgi:hypothetical protein
MKVTRTQHICFVILAMFRCPVGGLGIHESICVTIVIKYAIFTTHTYIIIFNVVIASSIIIIEA